MRLPKIIDESLEPLAIAAPPRPRFFSLANLRNVFGLTQPQPLLADFETLQTLPGIEQDQTNWCWAAVAQCVNEHFLAADPPPPGLKSRKQEDIAAIQYPDGECSGPGASNTEKCNKWAYLRCVLRSIGIPNDFDESFPNFDALKEKIDKKHPVPVRIQIKKNWYHFVVIYGYGSNFDLAVWDPGGTWKQTHYLEWKRKLGVPTHTYSIHL